MIAAEDPHRAPRDAQRFGEERDQRLVGGAFNGRGGHADEQRGISNAGAFRFSRARNDADVDLDARGGLLERLSKRVPNQRLAYVEPCIRRAVCWSVLPLACSGASAT
jgi:hypothetical protein